MIKFRLKPVVTFLFFFLFFLLFVLNDLVFVFYSDVKRGELGQLPEDLTGWCCFTGRGFVLVLLLLVKLTG